MNVNWPAPGAIGSILALVVLIVALVLGVIGSLPWTVAGLLIMLALSRLL